MTFPTAPHPSRRTLTELVNSTDPGWPLVADMIGKARNKVETLPVDPKSGENALLAIQVTTRSLLGAITYASGGLLVDHGWIRVLGGGGARRLPRNVGTWNFPSGTEQPARLANALLVADDVLGGFFALNGGAFDGPPGNVFYLAPDTWKWADVGCGYSQFIAFLCDGDLARFYDGQRWPSWKADADNLSGSRAYSIYPFLWAKGESIEQRRRKDVPIEELWSLHAVEGPKQLANVRDGEQVLVRVVNYPST